MVVTVGDGHVCASYAIAAGAVSHQLATTRVRRDMPDPIPVMVLARLAVDRGMQGQHLGGALLPDAVNRAVAVAQNVGKLLLPPRQSRGISFCTKGSD